MQITLETLFSPRLRAELEKDKPDGVEFRILPVYMQRDLDFTPVATVIVSFATNVAAGLFVDWLLKKFPERTRKKISISERETVWDKEELVRIIEEEIKKKIDSDSDNKK